MRQENEMPSRERKARFEAFEERLAFSAHSLSDFTASASLARVASQDGNQAAEYAPVAQVLTSPVTTPAQGAAIGASFGYDGSGQTVAVIDSGIAYDHKALGGGLGAGYRVVGGWDFAENDANPYDDGPAGFHGTHVAGIIGSSDNTYKGVASGADLVALRVFDDLGNSNFNWVESALRWVHENRNSFRNPITTVNLSIGTSWNANTVPTWATLEDELALLKADGIFVSVAAGNNFAANPTVGVSYPAVSPSVVPVASYDANGQLSSFSQRNDNVIAAPGQRITSTVPGYLHGKVNATNEFDTASGTSMAAPYVAGASMVLRQAMQALGYTNINQDTIVENMRKTADSVYDAITNSTYLKLNLERAIQALTPVDDYGSTASTAHSLGTVGSSGSFTGVINYANDADYFTLTAGQTGTMKLTSSHAASLNTQWQLVGGASSTTDSLSFEVVAGKTYTVALKGSVGTGAYSVSYNVQAPVVSAPSVKDLGTIAFSQFNNQNLTANETWYQFRASRDGAVTVEAFFNNAAGDVNLELLDANNKVLATSNSKTDAERVDVIGKEGQTFFIRLKGVNSQVNLRVTDLVNTKGSTVEVYGTEGNDTFTFTAGTQNQLVVNGVSYSFNASAANNFLMHGGGGSDTAYWNGSTASEKVTLRAGSGELRSDVLSVQGDSLEIIRVNGGGGTDSVSFYDSLGNDKFESRPDAAQMIGDGFANYATNIRQVYAYANDGGSDLATIYDTAGNDSVQAYSNYTTFTGGGISVRAEGFNRVVAISTGGFDVANLYDSKGNDTFVGTPDYAQLSGTGFSNQVRGYRNVIAISSQGGGDTATLYDGAGNDSLVVSAGSVTLYGTNFNNRAQGFVNVNAYASLGTDKATFSGMTSVDRFVGQGNTASWKSARFNASVTGFDGVSARSSGNAAVTSELGAVDYLLEKIGNWTNTPLTASLPRTNR